jgi:hypothetical protein
MTENVIRHCERAEEELRRRSPNVKLNRSFELN